MENEVQTSKAAAPTEEHDVYIDGAGWGQRHMRLTCRTDACSNGYIMPTLLRQPWMDDSDWEPLLAEFKQKHPFTTPKRYPGE